MKHKKITAILSQILLLCSLTTLSKACEEKSFWESWYPNGSFKGFGTPPEKLDFAKAQYHLSENYFKGNHLTKDYTRAVSLYQLAADNGVERAHFKLGLMNHYGKGKLKNLTEAYNHYSKAAKNNI
ncbi:MAG: sel1 repeat family protein, partial [Betaproteobacteria bacterium]|nr:sel1 repeat family protein [Betaproteobacteria bacterium]